MLPLKIDWRTETGSGDVDNLAVAGPQRVIVVGRRRVLDVRPRRVTEHKVGPKDLLAVAATPDWVAACCESGGIWDLRTFERRVKLKGTDSLVGLTVSRDHTQLFAADLTFVRVLDASTGDKLERYKMARMFAARSVLASVDERQLYAYADRGGDEAHVVRIERGVGVASRQSLAQNSALAVSGAGQVCTMGATHAALRDPSTLEVAVEWPVPDELAVLKYARWVGSPDDHHVLTLHGRTWWRDYRRTEPESRLVCWDTRTGEARVSRELPRIRAGAVGPNGRVALLDASGTVRVYVLPPL